MIKINGLNILAVLERFYQNVFLVNLGYRIELSWDEKLEWTKNRLEYDKLLNRHSVPTEIKDLSDMEELGEEEFDKISDKRNQMMIDIINDMKEKGEFDK